MTFKEIKELADIFGEDLIIVDDDYIDGEPIYVMLKFVNPDNDIEEITLEFANGLDNESTDYFCSDYPNIYDNDDDDIW